MGVSVFLSRPRPYNPSQMRFLEEVCQYLRTDRGLEPRTIGDTDYGLEPLKRIRGVLMDCNGLLAIGFKRTRIDQAVDRPNVSQRKAFRSSGPINNGWMTSPYCQIEPAMAFQIGLPILIIAERGVRPEGVLEPGVLAGDVPTFTLAGNGGGDFPERTMEATIEHLGRPSSRSGHAKRASTTTVHIVSAAAAFSPRSSPCT